MSFKHFFSTHFTESEIKANFKTINESRWWGKFKEDATSLLEYNDHDGKPKKFKVCKMEEEGNGPAYVLEARNGARYGLFRATEGKFHCIRMKSGKKHLIKPKGIFKEVEGKLVFELFAPKGMQKVGGGKELIQKAIANKKKAFNPEQTLGPVAPRVRQGEGLPKPGLEPKFDPNARLEELQVLDAPSSWKDAIAQDPETWTPKPGSVADFSKSSKDPATIGKMLSGKKHPYKFFVGNDGAVYQVLNDPITRGVWAVSKTDIDAAPFLKQRDPTQDAKLNEQLSVGDYNDDMKLSQKHDARFRPHEREVADFSQSASTPQQIAASLLKNNSEHTFRYFIANDNIVYEIDSLGNKIMKTGVDPSPYYKDRSPDAVSKVMERRATAEPDKSMPNGEPTFDKNTDEWNRGVYTDAKA